ncbi:MAG: hypothetical protein Q8Q67_00115 [bacterium]|nr:hypothetical protein [bacterium]
MSCQKDEDDPKPIIPPVEKQVEITVNFGPIHDDFDHEGGLYVNRVSLLRQNDLSLVADLVYSYPTTKSVFEGQSYSMYLGQTMYLYVRARKTLEGYSGMDHSHSWDVEIYVKISQLKEKNNIYVEFPPDHQYMVIGKP